MRHRVKKSHLGRDAAHRRALFRNLMTSLLREERITTTEAKAKAVKPHVERLISRAIRSLDAEQPAQVAARREVMRDLTDRNVMHKLFETVAPDLASRDGGYTRIVRLGPRRGDGAMMVILELVEGLAE